MQLTVKGKHLDVGDALREHVTGHITSAAEKYFDNPIEATVVLSKESARRFKAEISIHIGKGIMLQAHHEADDPYPAFDVASERMAKRMRRYKAKLKDHHKRMRDTEAQHQAVLDYTLQSNDDDDADKNAGESAIIAEMTTFIQEMSVSEAVMRLDLSDRPALMFKNSAHGELNMVYRRSDGNVGWVDPAGNEKK